MSENIGAVKCVKIQTISRLQYYGCVITDNNLRNIVVLQSHRIYKISIFDGKVIFHAEMNYN